MNKGTLKIYKAPPPRSRLRDVPLAAASLVRSAQIIATTPGNPFVPKEVEQARLKICESCPLNLWDPNGNFKLGKCHHERCKCSRAKHKFKSMSCPENFWTSYVTQS